MDASKIEIPIICGPTACGKTSLAIEISKKHPVEVISADSKQVVKYLNIGTAKPTVDERDKTVFHLIDLIEPGERYSAYDFIEDAGKAIEKITQRNNIPLLVGGTGLYLNALTEGVVEIEEEDFKIRDNLEKDFLEKGNEYLFDQLKKIDPIEAAKIHPNNKNRLIRALEIYYLTGKSKTEIMTTGQYKSIDYNYEYFCLMPPRDKLYEVINRRVDEMITNGLMDEIKELIKKDYENGIKKANVIGYNELLDHLNGNLSLDECVNLIKQNTRRYAKRQYTWFRHQITGKIYEDGVELTEAVGKSIEKSLKM